MKSGRNMQLLDTIGKEKVGILGVYFDDTLFTDLHVCLNQIINNKKVEPHDQRSGLPESRPPPDY
jgi:hypothetical protein